MSTGAAGSLSATLDSASRDIRRILAGVLDGHELSVDDGIALTGAAGRDLHAITLVADEMRRRQVGDVVTYVVNRNINFTNVCIKHCGFCAFSRDHREEKATSCPSTRSSDVRGRHGSSGRPRSVSRRGCRRSSTGTTTSTSRVRSSALYPGSICTPSPPRKSCMGR